MGLNPLALMWQLAGGRIVSDASFTFVLGKIGGDLAVFSSESRRAPASPVKTVWDI